MDKELTLMLEENQLQNSPNSNPAAEANRWQGGMNMMDMGQGKARVWYEVWNQAQQIEIEFERLSIEVEELEDRLVAFAKQKELARYQETMLKEKLREVIQYKRFKILPDKQRIAVVKQKLVEVREKTEEIAKHELAISERLGKKQGKLWRMMDRRNRVYEVLRSMNLS